MLPNLKTNFVLVPTSGTRHSKTTLDKIGRTSEQYLVKWLDGTNGYLKIAQISEYQGSPCCAFTLHLKSHVQNDKCLKSPMIWFQKRSF